ncbi:MAG: DUF3052 domain-containing protein [Pyrinomonadaceae bacterium]
MAGYSNTSLIKKLGIKEGFDCALVNSPKDFRKELGELPPKVTLGARSVEQLDFILLFTKSESMLTKEFPILAARLKPNGMLWVGWPKKSSGVTTDLSFERVQRVGLDAGLVDIKICAINEIWSGLKFVYRLRDRSSR